MAAGLVEDWSDSLLLPSFNPDDDLKIDFVPHPLEEDLAFFPDPAKTPKEEPVQHAEKQTKQKAQRKKHKTTEKNNNKAILPVHLPSAEKVSPYGPIRRDPTKCMMPNCTWQGISAHVQRKHNLEHSEHRPFPCPDQHCGRCFRRKTVVNEHIEHIHCGIYRCKHCGATFTRRDEHRQHLASHTGDIPSLCSVCDKLFPSRGALNRHMSQSKQHKDNLDRILSAKAT